MPDDLKEQLPEEGTAVEAVVDALENYRPTPERAFRIGHARDRALVAIEAYLSSASIPELLRAKEALGNEAPPESGSALGEVSICSECGFVDDVRSTNCGVCGGQTQQFVSLAALADNQNSPTELLALAAKGMSEEERAEKVSYIAWELRTAAGGAAAPPLYTFKPRAMDILDALLPEQDASSQGER